MSFTGNKGICMKKVRWSMSHILYIQGPRNNSIFFQNIYFFILCNTVYFILLLPVIKMLGFFFLSQILDFQCGLRLLDSTLSIYPVFIQRLRWIQPCEVCLTESHWFARRHIAVNRIMKAGVSDVLRAGMGWIHHKLCVWEREMFSAILQGFLVTGMGCVHTLLLPFTKNYGCLY